MLRPALENAQRWQDVESGLGALADSEREWDMDPAGWVSAYRHGDPARVG
jgi:hypothetical protein